MKDINVIDSSQAHLRVQYASIVKFICQKCDTAVVIDSEPHLILTCKTSIGCLRSYWLFRFSVLHSNNTVIMITY